MAAIAKHILKLLGEGALGGVGSAIGEELYQKLKEFLLDRSDTEKKSLNAKTSFKKPDTFFAIELDRISSQAAAYLLTLSSSERSRLIELARQGTAGNEEQTVSNLINIIQSRS